MKKIKKLVALATVMVMVGSSAKTFALDQYQQYAGGGGYIESRGAPNIAPAIALTAIAAIAIIVIAIQNANNEHGHSH